jgi:hypothetical protein
VTLAHSSEKPQVKKSEQGGLEPFAWWYFLSSTLHNSAQKDKINKKKKQKQ